MIQNAVSVPRQKRRGILVHYPDRNPLWQHSRKRRDVALNVTGSGDPFLVHAKCSELLP